MPKTEDVSEEPTPTPTPAPNHQGAARPNDIPIEEPRPVPFGNSTFAERAKSRNKRLDADRVGSK